MSLVVDSDSGRASAQRPLGTSGERDGREVPFDAGEISGTNSSRGSFQGGAVLATRTLFSTKLCAVICPETLKVVVELRTAKTTVPSS